MNVGIFCNYFEDIILNAIKDGSASLASGRYIYLHDGDPMESGALNDITTPVLGGPINATSLTFSTPTYNSSLDQWETTIQNNISFTPTAGGILKWLTWGDSSDRLARVEIVPNITLQASTPVTILAGTISFAVRRCGQGLATNILTALLSNTTTLARPSSAMYVGLCTSLTADNTRAEPSLFTTRAELTNPSTNFTPPTAGEMDYIPIVPLGNADTAATINFVGIFDSDTLPGGDLIFFASLPSPVSIPVGAPVYLQNLKVTCD